MGIQKEKEEKDNNNNNNKPQLTKAENPFNGMKPTSIADTKKKENETGKQQMEHVRKNSLPTSSDKPKHKPMLSKENIRKFKPPVTKKLPNSPVNKLKNKTQMENKKQ